MIVITAVLALVASFVGTLAGFGIATIMLPLLLTFLPTDQAIVLVAIIHWFNDIWKLWFFRKGINRQLFLYFGIPSVLCSILGAFMVTTIPFAFFHRILGLFLILYVLMLYFFPHVRIPSSRGYELLGGALSGFSAGFFGIRGVITSSFLLAYQLHKEIFLATIGAIALLIDSARIMVYFQQGMRLTAENSYWLLLFIGASFVGAYAARLCVTRISQEKFRALVAVLIGVVGLKLLFW
ncbi:MAG: sulfite exporter TauE/SafE family protein [Candidatus Babeliales bacterium]